MERVLVGLEGLCLGCSVFEIGMGGFGLRFFESFHCLHMFSLHFCASLSRLRRTERIPLMPLLPMLI